MQEFRKIDDETAAYISQVQRPFEDLRQVAARIAGFLVLNAAGANTASPDHPMLGSAQELLREAMEKISLAGPTTRARLHHTYLMGATGELSAALRSARAGLSVDPVLVPLRRAYDLLQNCANRLPGFEMVAFAQGCCAHGSSVPRTQL